MPRSKIGPLLLEAPIGGRGSSVYRAIHAEQKLQLAVRIFSVQMGMTPEVKKAFTQEVEELKKIRHANIARCFGGGFDQRDAYLVYELIEGTSFGEELQRSQRLPWQLVLQYGLQLSDALQYAHHAGWLHGRIRPDKLICRKGQESIVIADFRRDLEMAAIMGAKQPTEYLVYQSPEAIDGQMEASSDLYSLGAILYHALTGHPPFPVTTVAEIKSRIAHEAIPSVSTEVFECPVWLSKIVEQLLEKEPARRPFSAAAVGLAFQEAQKRESQKIGVAQHVLSGFSPLQVQADRAEAEKVLGRRKKKQERRRSESAESEWSLTNSPWFIIGCIFLLIVATVYFLLPPGEAKLYQRALAAVKSDEYTNLVDARDRYLLPLLERFPEGEHRQWAQDQIDQIDMMTAERRMERNARFNRDPSSEGERKYLEARRYERFGDRVTALSKYRAIEKLLEDVEEERPFVLLARRQIRQIEDASPSIQELKKFLTEKLDEARLMMRENRDEAREIATSIVKLYDANEECKAIVEAAKKLLNLQDE